MPEETDRFSSSSPPSPHRQARYHLETSGRVQDPPNAPSSASNGLDDVKPAFHVISAEPFLAKVCPTMRRKRILQTQPPTGSLASMHGPPDFTSFIAINFSQQ